MNTLERQGHNFDSPVHIFDLEETVMLLKEEKPLHSGQHNAVTLAKGSSINVVLMLLQKGSSLPEHQTAGALSLLVISGLVDFVAARETTHLKAGMFLALGEGIPHQLTALEESVLLLTVVR